MKTTSRNLFVVLFMVITVGTSLAWTAPGPLTELNTSYGEGWPYLSSDGLTLYFSRGNTSNHYWHQLYQATRSMPSGPFSNVTRIDELAYNGHVHSAWVSSDNMRMYFMRTEPGSIWRLKVSTRTTANSQWGAPENLTELNNLGDVAHPRLSADELTIVFNVFQRESIGYLYTASRSSRNLPFTHIRVLSELNTSMDTRPTYLSADGLTVYFVRNDNGVWHNYVSIRSSLTGIFAPAQLLSDWPENYSLGCFSADGRTAYLGFNGDIYISTYDDANLVSIEIAGPNEVAENGETQYKAIAHFDDGSNKDITKEVNWFAEDSDFAAIDANGLLGCDQVFTFETVCTIHAEIEDSNEVFAAQKRVKIIPMCSTGSAAQFDGLNDYVNMGSSPAFNTEKLTLSFWAKLNKPNGQFQGGVVKGWAFGNQYEYSYQLVFHEGIARAAVITTTSAAQVNAPIVDDKWHNWVLTFGDGRISIYRDSVLVETKPFAGQIDYSKSHNNFIVGARDNRQYSIDGLIDEVSIFNHALSAGEIQYNMNNKLSGAETGLVGYWDFDEGQGQIAHDKSGNGNHGILGGTEKIESSDPAWFSLGHPCSRNELIKRNLSTAREIKQDILSDLDYALKAETAAQKMLMDMQREKDFSLWKIFDIVRARVYTQVAILKEYAAKEKIQSSNQDLSNALKTLEEPEKKIKDNKKP